MERYNIAASVLSPPRSALSWDEVVHYAFLADFDLLRDTREDIRERPWARPAARTTMDAYFKMVRAEEEIYRLNIEIRRVITHLRDEGRFLSAREHEFEKVDPVLAYQLQCYRLQRERYTSLHMQRFKKLATTPGFSGTILPGVPLDKTLTNIIHTNTNNTVSGDGGGSGSPEGMGKEDHYEGTGNEEDPEDDVDNEDEEFAEEIDIIIALQD